LDDDEKFQATSLGVLMAGVIGNLIDRVRQGYVVDMFKAYTEYEPWRDWLIETFRTNVWPIFNVADICINLGVGLILFHYLFLEGRRGDDEDVEVDAAALPPVEA
ncbi:MAG: signal peptidase II, partial [Actinomycetia bacterium]|nr:signal peptidase II [Actinomycetes bacterium]